MKQIYTISFAVLIALSSIGQTRSVNKVITWYGNWSNKNSWSLNRLPQDGDSIVIADGRGIVVDKAITLNGVHINITSSNNYIHLKVSLVLDDASILEIGQNSRIMGFGANRNTETITIGGVKKFDQNANVNLYGFGIASKFTGVSPNGFSTNIAQALPVSFTAFYARLQGNAIVLSWATAQEKNNSHFEIERSNDGRNWKIIAIVMGNSTTNRASQYGYMDKNELSAVVYYRIRQVDQNGQATYTSVKMIRSSEDKTQANMYASSKNTVTIDLNSDTKTNMMVTVLQMNGQVVAKQFYSSASDKMSISVPHATNGVYLVIVGDEKGWKESKKIIL